MNQPRISSPSVPVRILVVDDHIGTATTLARAISQVSAGLEVIPATSGQEALARVRHAAADILITDMIMPEMTGLQLIEKLQNNPSGRPTFTFLITAYDVPGLRLTARHLNVTEVFTKPINPERICQIILQSIEKISQAKPGLKELSVHNQFTVLIADDQPDNVLLLARYLENEGFSYIQAKDGLETLEKVRTEKPDLVLLDVNMPNKDGFTVLEEIRADPAVQHIPVIILTAARLDSIEVQFGLNLGADDYITKPFNKRELLARIRTKLRAKETEHLIRRRLDAILQTTGDVVLIFDEKARLFQMNPAGRRLFADCEMKPGEELCSGKGYDSFIRFMDRACLSDGPFSGEVVWPDSRVFAASLTPIDRGGCVVVLHERTRLRDPNGLKNELMNSTGHELCNPIPSEE